MCEITALGVAIAAGCAEGIKKWDINVGTNVPSDTFTPSITENGIYCIIKQQFLFHLSNLYK